IVWYYHIVLIQISNAFYNKISIYRWSEKVYIYIYIYIYINEYKWICEYKLLFKKYKIIVLNINNWLKKH
ncbi:MAG: hypothetical protein N7Q72_06115, partial [Spiroplasma sp. Tabriz.8]|nr:hypothetical protein [Spiroplasma sp. Tabriz.8]